MQVNTITSSPQHIPTHLDKVDAASSASSSASSPPPRGLTLSRVLQASLLEPIIERKKYADEIQKTILVKNLNPKTTRNQIISLFEVPHGIRNVKW